MLNLAMVNAIMLCIARLSVIILSSDMLNLAMLNDIMLCIARLCVMGAYFHCQINFLQFFLSQCLDLNPGPWLASGKYCQPSLIFVNEMVDGCLQEWSNLVSLTYREDSSH